MKYLYPVDWKLWTPIIILLFFSLLILCSLSLHSAAPLYDFKRQLIFIIIGLFCYFLVAHFDYQTLRNHSLLILIIYFLSIISLILVLIVGKNIRGINAWFSFGSFSLQPVEFAKIALVLVLAKYLSTRNMEIWRLSPIIVSGIYTAIPCALALLQPDLGSVIIFFAIWLGLLMISGMRWRHFCILIILILCIALLGWQFLLKPYQKERIISFLNPTADPHGSSYNLKQSIIAIGSGKIWGKGLGWGTQTQLQFLPEAKTDFVFAAWAEETGFVGITFLFCAFFAILKRLYEYALVAPNNFARLFSFGFLIKLTAEIILNIGVNVGFLPVVGIALPFMSLGGSHLIADFIMLGIASNIYYSTNH